MEDTYVYTGNNLRWYITPDGIPYFIDKNGDKWMADGIEYKDDLTELFEDEL